MKPLRHLTKSAQVLLFLTGLYVAFAADAIRVATKYRRPKANEPLYIILDAGNTDVKAMIHGHFGEEIVFPHFVYRPNKTEYQNIASKFKFRKAQFEGTAIFQSAYKDENGDEVEQGYVVGLYAAQNDLGERLIGPSKYLRGHIGALFEAAMLQLYPESHGDVHIVILHPADVSGENIDRLGRALYGKHVVDLPDGRKVTYKVREIIPVEEPVAALQEFVLNTKGEPYADSEMEIRPGMEFLILDIGGGLTGFVPCIISETGKIEHNLIKAPVVQAGIQNVMPALETQLQDGFEQLALIQGLPESMLNYALMTGLVNISGDDFPCEDRVANAMSSIAAPIKNIFNTTYKKGVGFRAIVITGGGGGVSFNFVKTNIVKHPHVFPAVKDLNRMRYGAIRGASKGLYNFLRQNHLSLSAPEVIQGSAE